MVHCNGMTPVFMLMQTFVDLANRKGRLVTASFGAEGENNVQSVGLLLPYGWRDQIRDGGEPE